jgi:hypothetical protein
MTRAGHPLQALIGLVLAATVAVGCGSSVATPAPASASSAPASGGTTPSSSPAATSSQAATAGKVNANTASEAELAAAFTAAGIPNADRWAREVAEYRPYDADPTWAHLRQELAKYNIDPTVLEQILATLEI